MVGGGVSTSGSPFGEASVMATAPDVGKWAVEVTNDGAGGSTIQGVFVRALCLASDTDELRKEGPLRPAVFLVRRGRRSRSRPRSLRSIPRDGQLAAHLEVLLGEE